MRTYTNNNKRYSYTAFFAFILCLVLSGCGAKVSSVRNLTPEGSGTLVLNMTMPRDADAETKINGGFSAIEESIKKHCPEELTFSGLTVSDKEVTGSFALDFSSIEDYQDKVKAVLEAGGLNTEVRKPDITFLDLDSPLKKGVTYKENFDNKDLLEWLPEALVTDGVIEESNKVYVFDNTGRNNAILQYNDQSYENSSASGIGMSISPSVDNGFDDVSLILEPKFDGSYNATFRFARGSSPASAVSDLDDEFFDSLDSDVKEVDLADISESKQKSLPSLNKGSYARYLEFDATDNKDLTEKMESILGENAFAIEGGDPNPYQDDGLPYSYLGILQTFSGYYNPAALCSEDSSSCGKLDFFEGDALLSNNTCMIEDFSSGLFEASCMRQAQFTSLDFDVDISSEKSAGITLSVGIDKDKAEFFDKALVKHLDPGKKLGSLSKKDEGEERIYTVKINDTEDIDGLSSYFGSQILHIAPYSESSISSSFISNQPSSIDQGADYYLNLNFSPGGFLKASPIEKVTAQIDLPAFHSFTIPEGYEGLWGDWKVDGSTATLAISENAASRHVEFHASVSSSLTMIIVLVVVGILILLTAVLLFIFRKKIRDVLAKKKLEHEQRKEAHTHALTSPSLENSDAPSPAADPSQATDGVGLLAGASLSPAADAPASLAADTSPSPSDMPRASQQDWSISFKESQLI